MSRGRERPTTYAGEVFILNSRSELTESQRALHAEGADGVHDAA